MVWSEGAIYYLKSAGLQLHLMSKSCGSGRKDESRYFADRLIHSVLVAVCTLWLQLRTARFCFQESCMVVAAHRLPARTGVGTTVSAGDRVRHGVPSLAVHRAWRPQVCQCALQIVHL